MAWSRISIALSLNREYREQQSAYLLVLCHSFRMKNIALYYKYSFILDFNSFTMLSNINKHMGFLMVWTHLEDFRLEFLMMRYELSSWFTSFIFDFCMFCCIHCSCIDRYAIEIRKRSLETRWGQISQHVAATFTLDIWVDCFVNKIQILRMM